MVAAVVAEAASAKEGGQSVQVSAGAGAADFGAALATVEGLVLVTPRGRQALAFFERHCVFRAAGKADISVPYVAISHIAIIDSIPNDTKGRVLVFLHLARGAAVMRGKRALPALVIQTSASVQLDLPAPLGQGARMAGPAPVVLCQLFGLQGVPPAAFCSPSPDVFRSADRRLGVSAVVKVSQGWLFPMAAAFCFLERPALLLPLAEIGSVEFARAAGTSSTFDLLLHARDGTTHEFTSIPRAELAGLTAYVAEQRLPVGTADVAAAAAPCARYCNADDAPAEVDEDSEEDADFDPDCSSSSAAGGARLSGAETGDGQTGGSAADEADADSGSRDLGNDEEEEEEESDDGSSVSLVSEDDIPSANVRHHMSEEEGHAAKRRRR
ncbi:hypothetical protein WJX81_008487 [Elliptochloris bilobata]|uniref:FACT complex subunit SSRP1 n=1 Tax=Elliptochloris bilobata TaxID=381761 RepID=A0AAW1QD86_9CHLO